MMNFLKNKKIQIVFFLIFFFTISFSVSYAETTYTLLEGLPYIGESGESVTLTGYLSGAFRLAFGIAILLSVFQLSFGGFKYLTEESFTGKTNAKSKINNAIFGLVLIFVSYLLLNFINPDLVNIRFEIPKVGNSESDYAVVPEPPRERTAAEIRDDYRETYAPREVSFMPGMEGTETNCKTKIAGYDFVGDEPKLGTNHCVYVAK